MAVADDRADVPVTATVPFTVMWRDADPAGWIHYGAVTRYFDAAEEALFAHAGITYAEQLTAGRGYPRVHVEYDFRRPLRVHDRGSARACIGRLGTTSITVELALVRDGDTTPAVEGKVTMVVIDWATGRPCEVPAELRRAWRRDS